MLRKDGILSLEEYQSILPDEKRRKQGPYAVLECFQSIPCNPCATVCKFHAIQMEHISDVPKIDYEKCIGCTACVTACPGHACFVIDETYSQQEVLITLPYEFYPVPQKGDKVDLLKRDGAVIGEGKIIRIRESGKTYAVTVSVPKEYIFDVRSIKGKENCNGRG